MPDDPAPNSLSERSTLGHEEPSSTGSFGRYRRLQRLGEGGMGEVWLAEQTEPVRRQVALKVIKAGMDSAQVVARFEAERQALALMDHPAIARVFDGGTTPQGRPYFAMEYIKGEPMTAYCDRHRLSTTERLGLFMQVCEGVQHAHQKGIIHRDLKPSNVLVAIQDDHAVPKIIDFGVAKATAQHLTERSLFTELGVLIGTPEYMSPEQAEMGSLDIDTRTDVYALGVLLYELLTGALPFDRKEMRQAGLAEIQRIIREQDPPRPSTRITQLGPASTEAAQNRHTEPRRLVSELRGDLDWITMRALEKDRTRRYQTANALSADIRRHLSSEPVSAGPPSTTYRAGKFVRRHRFGVAVSAALVLLLAVVASALALQARRIAQERNRANREAETARQVAGFLVSLFEVSKPSEVVANSITAREVLDRGVERMDDELQSQPETRAALLATMGGVYRSLGLHKKSESLHRKAWDVGREAFGPHSAQSAASETAVADNLLSQGRITEAEPMLREALEIRRGLFGEEHLEVAHSLSRLGWCLVSQAKYAEAETVFLESLRVRQRLLESADLDLVSTLTGLGEVLRRRGGADDLARAARYFRDALDVSRRAFRPGHPKITNAEVTLASVLMSQGRWREAEDVYRDSLRDLRVRLGTTHPELTAGLSQLGAALYLQGKYPEAEASYSEALAINRKAFGEQHPTVALCLANLGQAQDAMGRYAQAEAALREALDIDRKALGDGHPDVATDLTFLSVVLRHLNRPVQAEAAAREALAIYVKSQTSGDNRVREAEGALGAALLAQRQWQQAEPLLLSFAEALEKNPRVEGDRVEVERQIAEMYDAWGKPEKAKEWRAKLEAQTVK